MSETAAATASAIKTKVAPGTKKRTRRAAKRKLTAKLNADKEFAKTFFGARSKRANDKKSTFRKKKSRKK